jgi:hypothetical protein
MEGLEYFPACWSVFRTKDLLPQRFSSWQNREGTLLHGSFVLLGSDEPVCVRGMREGGDKEGERDRGRGRGSQREVREWRKKIPGKLCIPVALCE